MTGKQPLITGLLTVIALLASAYITGAQDSTAKERRQSRRQAITERLEQADDITPTFSNVSYGSHRRNVLDFWQAESSNPTPFVVFIHGGAFVTGSKEKLNPITLKALLSSGISVAAINYRFTQHARLPAAHHDARRALQFLRSKAKEWNLNKNKVGAFGASAGAQLSMYLAFHDDMADPQSSDPVERESTRLTCVVSNGGQSTMDVNLWVEWVPGFEFPVNFNKQFGDLSETELERVIADISAMDLVSADDPPLQMTYNMKPGDPIPENPDDQEMWELHHVIFGIKLKEKMDALNLESHLQYPGHPSSYKTTVQFFNAKLK